jgi:outer membrane protein assembly factor BamB
LEAKYKFKCKTVLVDNYIFTVSDEGYLFVIEKHSGNIIRITDLFDMFKTKKEKNYNQ